MQKRSGVSLLKPWKNIVNKVLAWGFNLPDLSNIFKILA